jgi:hypothetical protein
MNSENNFTTLKVNLERIKLRLDRPLKLHLIRIPKLQSNVGNGQTRRKANKQKDKQCEKTNELNRQK